jgi:uncharacterized membrane protein
MNSGKSLSKRMTSQELTARTHAINVQSKAEPVEIKNLNPLPLELEKIEAEAGKLTLGQRVADAMASKVGSWGFLIGQTIVLTGWVGANLMPGVPHWDQSPFILLNLVFSFASAYTAPVVLMSQNRQSDVERKKAEYDRLVNQKASHDIELLHKKFDVLYAQKLQELTQLIQMQQQPINEMLEDESKVPNKYSVYIPFNLSQPIEDSSKVITRIHTSLNDSETF